MGAPKGNKFAKSNRGGGRPTLYKPQYAEIVRRMCAQGAAPEMWLNRTQVLLAYPPCGVERLIAF
jgi:hypothetical protein